MTIKVKLISLAGGIAVAAYGFNDDARFTSFIENNAPSVEGGAIFEKRSFRSECCSLMNTYSTILDSRKYWPFNASGDWRASVRRRTRKVLKRASEKDGVNYVLV